MQPRIATYNGIGSTRAPDFAPCGARALFLTEHRTSHLAVLMLLPTHLTVLQLRSSGTSHLRPVALRGFALFARVNGQR
ncbi:hypothetical protein [Methanoculleus chikugoensis]|uniref:hypothetical protein n=1 Tax=Methanoculleus chikugoensis TaxID=118126 RepID=UPI001FB4BE23|nr:hypothetical protein [Methanoculleus chikugoensis]